MANGRRLPTSFTAGRRLTLEGTTYNVGDAIPNAVVARTHGVNGYLSRRWIIPTPEHKGLRVNAAKPRPTHLNSAEIRTLLSA